MATPRPAKRKLPAPTDHLASRKRAFAACAFCRARKTKCDNARPICGYCRLHNATCIYDEDTDVPIKPPEDATQRVMQRFDDLERLIRASTFSGQDPTTSSTPQLSMGDGPALFLELRAKGCKVDHRSLSLDSRRCESVLAWPIFAPILPPEICGIDSLAFHVRKTAHLEARTNAYSVSPADGPLSSRNRKRGLNEDDILPLIRSFIEHVLPRNPVLDGPDLLRMAGHIAEDGLDWSAESCLVLLCCALASVSTPWSIAETPQGSTPTEPVVPDSEGLAVAHVFYSAAQKRLGSLENELIDVHCYLFACIYDKSILEPIQAMLKAQQASTRLQFYRKCLPDTECLASKERSLLQRAHESTRRAESELAIELDFGKRCQDSNEDHATLPQPPSGLASIDGSVDNSNNATNNLEQPIAREGQGWYFYLAEISLRRMMEDTAQLLHKDGPQGWMSSGLSLVNRSQACEEQVDLWAMSIPGWLSAHFADNSPPGNEFARHLKYRLLQWRQMLTLPLLYVAVHSNEVDLQIARGAEKCVEYSVERLLSRSYVGRHGGTWFMLRSTFLSAMLICSYRLSSFGSNMPTSWSIAVDAAVDTLRDWSDQAKDVHAMLEILETTYTNIRP